MRSRFTEHPERTLRAAVRAALLREDAGGTMRLADALAQVKDSSESALQKATVIARALDRSDSAAAQQILRDLKNCIAGLQLAVNSTARAVARAGSVS